MIKAVIFDLDGVIVSTDDCHYRAWKEIADQENIHFDRTINERLRGVSRMESLEIILERAEKKYSYGQKLSLAEMKNEIYKKLILGLSPNDILKGVGDILRLLSENNIKIAIGSSSKNTPIILKQIGLEHVFNAVSDGNNITKSKPDPEVFLKAAEMLNVAYPDCLVFEDADAGIEAAVAANMTAFGIGFASNNRLAKFGAKDMCEKELIRELKLLCGI